MTDGTPGWFKDPSDPSLARWHDGTDWTEHTLVIADQTPGSEPLPPVMASPEAPHSARHGRSAGSDDDRPRSVPLWVKLGAPVAALILGVLAFSIASSSNDSDDKTTTVDTVTAGLDDAVDAARLSGLPTSISDARAGELIELICGAAERPSTKGSLGRLLGGLPVASEGELRSSVDALADGARELCPSQLSDSPGLIAELQRAAVTAFGTTTTAPTLVPDGTVAGAGVADPDGAVTTVKKGSATTTKPSTATTKAPAVVTTTTTTLPGVLKGQGCTSEGAKARDKITNASLTCSKPCYGSSTKLTWQATCTTTTTIQAPSTTAGPPPTQPPPTSSTTSTILD